MFFLKKLGLITLILAIVPACSNRNRGGDDSLGCADPEVVNAIQESGDRVFFDFDSSALSIESRDTLNRQAEVMLKYSRAGFEIEGHADARGFKDYNFALGERRAAKAKEYLVSKGVNPANLHVISYGKEMPAVEGDTEEAYAQNRRAVTVPKSNKDKMD